MHLILTTRSFFDSIWLIVVATVVCASIMGSAVRTSVGQESPDKPSQKMADKSTISAAFKSRLSGRQNQNRLWPRSMKLWKRLQPKAIPS